MKTFLELDTEKPVGAYLTFFYSLPEPSVSRLCFKQYPENGREKKNCTWSIGASLHCFCRQKNVGCFQLTHLTWLTYRLTTHYTGQNFLLTLKKEAQEKRSCDLERKKGKKKKIRYLDKMGDKFGFFFITKCSSRH